MAPSKVVGTPPSKIVLLGSDRMTGGAGHSAIELIRSTNTGMFTRNGL